MIKKERDSLIDDFAAEMKRRLDLVVQEGSTLCDSDYPAQAMRTDILHNASQAFVQKRSTTMPDIGLKAALLWAREQQKTTVWSE